MTFQFSAFNRPIIINRLRDEAYDLLIIGGGITGAGIALDAASRGLKVALVEKNDFAYGTSSRSTKLIHGGLRYLKQLEFGLVKEVGSERAVVHKLAPHLVIPEKMLLPLSEKKGLGYWLTSIGLKIYDWLAGVSDHDKRKMLTRNQTLNHEPLLRADDIKGGAIYAEYRTDDARLTLEIIKTAIGHGALAVNYVKVEDFLYTEGQISEIKVCDVLQNSTFNIKAKVVVSATGPWVDELRDINKSKTGKRLHLTKGVHIVVSAQRFPVRQAIYFDVDDGRMIFAIPRGRITYMGTTDTNYQGSIDHVTTSIEDATYLVQAVNARFPVVKLSLQDIESSWAGLRPLIHEEGKSASDLSRKDEIFESTTGLISIAGGKLTGYRKMAERVVSLVIKKYFEDRELKDCYTDNIKLSSIGFNNSREVKEYIQKIAKNLKKYIDLEPFYAQYLVYNYGRQADEILSRLNNDVGRDTDLSLALAELDFCIHHEMVLTPMDFFVRRTGMLYFYRFRLEKLLTPVLVAFKEYFSWSDSVMLMHREEITMALNNAKNFN